MIPALLWAYVVYFGLVFLVLGSLFLMLPKFLGRS